MKHRCRLCLALVYEESDYKDKYHHLDDENDVINAHPQDWDDSLASKSGCELITLFLSREDIYAATN